MYFDILQCLFAMLGWYTLLTSYVDHALRYTVFLDQIAWLLRLWSCHFLLRIGINKIFYIFLFSFTRSWIKFLPQNKKYKLNVRPKLESMDLIGLQGQNN